MRMANAKAGNAGNEILHSCPACQRNRVGFDFRNFAWKGQRLARILGLRRAVAVDHLMRDPGTLREKPADDGLRVWGAQMVGSFVIVKAPVDSCRRAAPSAPRSWRRRPKAPASSRASRRKGSRRRVCRDRSGRRGFRLASESRDRKAAAAPCPMPELLSHRVRAWPVTPLFSAWSSGAWPCRVADCCRRTGSAWPRRAAALTLAGCRKENLKTGPQPGQSKSLRKLPPPLSRAAHGPVCRQRPRILRVASSLDSQLPTRTRVSTLCAASTTAASCGVHSSPARHAGSTQRVSSASGPDLASPAIHSPAKEAIT